MSARECRQCGERLPEDAHPNAKYCGEQCRHAGRRTRANSRYSRTHHPRAVCAYCGGPMPPRAAWNATACSRECRLARRREQSRARRYCAQCGTELTPGAPSRALYCSPECRKAGERAYNAAYREAHHEEIQERKRNYMLTYYEQHKEERATYARRYRQEHAAEESARSRRYREAHAEELRNYREAHAVQNRARARQYYAENRERQQQYYAEHREDYRRRAYQRRAAQLAVESVPFTPEDMTARMALFGNRCWACGAPADHVDHIIPLQPREGEPQGADRIDNFAPLCSAGNIGKSNRPVPYWLPRRLADLLEIPVKDAKRELDALVMEATGRPAADTWKLFTAEQPDYEAITEAVRMLAAVLGTYNEQEDAA